MNLTKLLQFESEQQHHHGHHHNAVSDSKHVHSYEANDQAFRVVITSLYALSGFLTVLFNGNMIVLYLKVPRLQKTISPVLLKLFVFCMIMGLVNGGFVNILLNLLYDIPTWWCVFSQLCIRFFNDYFLLLIPTLIIERYLTVIYPYTSRPRLLRFAVLSTIISSIIVVLVRLIPYFTFMEPSNELHYAHAAESRYHRASSCNGKLSISNPYAPVLELILQVVCVVVVFTVYVKMFYVLKDRLTMFSALTFMKRERLRRSARCLTLISSAFLLLTVPKGLLFEVASLCDNAWLNGAVCAPLTNNLLHVFAITSSFASFISPLLFTILNPKLRKGLIMLYLKEGQRRIKVMKQDSNKPL